ncbi:DNA mismatch repair endonuclease MutL [uncultured Alistipes sp.]|jgi:DNA mismatch repair protein MutL|uniref:DNA mismatch repair endonuclease MutL n=1 Tax=uncultured Alistipes sp. TaxID=538949 RepID=UPI0025ED9C86|nr:DNA mismatch repair endonuclease MutL [uncultured Alistipes sp.]
MADKIRLLPEVVANQIAAGEVVNRPSSVVKEMMENAIDAGARSVKVNFRDGGKDLIQIVDDGCGMSPIDARMAFDRHATSKIASVDDIYALHTFGFRGEALASIAAVAQVELRTRQEGDETGTETLINGGTFAGQHPVACAVGSQFFVRNLFYNVPARRRFLEKKTTSATQIRTEFQRVALCNPKVHFELYNNDAPVYNLAPGSTAARIVDVIGRHIRQNLLEVEADTSIARIEGYVGRPAAAKKRNNEQYLFVNGRYFSSPYLAKAVLKAYEKLIPESCTPSFFLYLTIDPSRIDVNVSPQKTEVKFADEEAVWQIVHAAVRETLGKTGAVPMMDFDEAPGVEIPVLRQGAVYGEPRAMSNADYNPFREEYVDHAAPQPEVEFAGFDVPYGGAVPPSNVFREVASSFGTPALHEVPGDADDEVFESAAFGGSELEFIPSASDEPQQQRLELDGKPRFSDVVPVGGGLAVARYGGRLVAADLRRARERVLYENYLVLLGNGSSVSQQLLFPERLVLSEEEYALMEENAVEFAGLGFDVDYCGGGAVEVRGTPADMPADAIDRLLYELLQAFDTPHDLADVRREKIARVMARNAARTAQRFTAAEAAALLDQLGACGDCSFSPSGKAVMAEITIEELRKKLG